MAKAKIKAKVSHQSGKRKTAKARATVKAGNGTVKINKISLDQLTPELAKMRIQEALLIAGPIVEKLSISVNVIGGGWSSQAEASRLAIAKALVEHTGSEELKKNYHEYDRHLLVADTRRKEPRKPMTHSRARAKRQKSYR